MADGIDRCIEEPRAREAVRNAVGTDLSERLSISLHVERYSRVKGKKRARQGREGEPRRPVHRCSGTNAGVRRSGGNAAVRSGPERDEESKKPGPTDRGDFSCGFAVRPRVYFRRVTSFAFKRYAATFKMAAREESKRPTGSFYCGPEENRVCPWSPAAPGLNDRSPRFH